MNEQELNAQDRAHMDKRWQEDVAWLEKSGAVPERGRPKGDGLIKSFENQPLLWSLVVLALGGIAFVLLSVFMY